MDQFKVLRSIILWMESLSLAGIAAKKSLSITMPSYSQVPSSQRKCISTSQNILETPNSESSSIGLNDIHYSLFIIIIETNLLYI